MNNENVGFVEFHRPGRLILIGAILVPIAVLFFGLVREPLLMVLSLVGAPFVLLLIDFVSKRKLLPQIQNGSVLHKKLLESKISWLYNDKGRGVKGFDRTGLGLPRTIGDSSLQKELNEIEIPKGLTEPEQIRGAIPSNVVTSIIGCIFCLLLLFGMWRLARSTAPPNMRMFAWGVMFIVVLCFCLLIIGLPVFQKKKVLPDFFRYLGRGQLLSKGFVVGPGWLKQGGTVWNADTDLLLIRRTGWRSASAEVVCLLVSDKKRKKIRFSGVNDTDFRTLFGFWNINEVRIEFVDSELS
jgi:hypothetical protein